MVTIVIGVLGFCAGCIAGFLGSAILDEHMTLKAEKDWRAIEQRPRLRAVK